MVERRNNKEMNTIDLSVLLIFFTRADHFSRVWEEVKKARPARLFLYQDGPRGDRDMPGIMECRALVADENIDWPCEVHRLYQERNYGCDPSEFIAQKWAFSFVDRCMVLEDDDVPSQAFFPFCKELLDRYADDERVWMIAGFNTDEVTRLPEKNKDEDYFFTSILSIWGWASWKRVLDTWDPSYSWMDDADKVRKMEEVIRRRGYRKDLMQMCRKHRASGIPYYETVFWSSMLLNDGLAIMPTRNMVNNIGVDGGTHYAASLETMPKRIRKMFTMKRFDITFPLNHPAKVEEWMPFKEHFYRAQGWNHPWIKIGRSLEELWLNLIRGNFSIILKALKARIRKNLGRNDYA